MAQTNFSTEKKLMDMENRFDVASEEGEGEGVGWIGSLDANDFFFYFPTVQQGGQVIRRCIHCGYSVFTFFLF